MDQNRPLQERFGITSIPTLLFFKDGEMLNDTIVVKGEPLVINGIGVGAFPEYMLREIIDQM